MSLQLPQDSPSRPLSIRTTGTSATMADKTGEAWRGAVDKHNCWEDLILTLGMCRIAHGERGGSRDIQAGAWM